MKYKKLKIAVGLLVFGYLIVNVFVMIGIGRDMVELVTLVEKKDVAAIKLSSQKFATKLRLIHQTSLGAYKLPWLAEIDSLLVTSNLLITDSLKLADYLQKIATVGLSGEGSIKIESFSYIEAQLLLLAKQTDELQNQLNHPKIERLARVIKKEDARQRGHSMLEKLGKNLNIAAKATPLLPSILGFEKEMQYKILLQNNMELRPTGGFMGSFIDLTVAKGRVKNFEVEDIYVPDGQLIVGYVPQPEPLRKYLFNDLNPGWRLRDSNWSPDFPTTASTVDWFFQKGNYPASDGIFAVNLWPIVDVIELMEPVRIADYSLAVTKDNFYEQAQYYAESDFFPGSTAKKDFLGSVGKQLMINLLQEPEKYMTDLLAILYDQLEHKQIMMAIFDEEAAAFLAQQNWDGGLVEIDCLQTEQTCFTDYLMLVEANLGSNKANCCMKRKISHDIDIEETEIVHKLEIEFQNENPVDKDNSQDWGGSYKNYLRILVPAQTNLESITIDGKVVEQSELTETVIKNKKSIGFLVIVPEMQSSLVRVAYLIDRKEIDDISKYQLYWQKQSGIDEIPIELQMNGNWKYNPEKSDSYLSSENGLMFMLNKDINLVFESSN